MHHGQRTQWEKMPPVPEALQWKRPVRPDMPVGKSRPTQQKKALPAKFCKSL